jgi:iron-sulfur cluster assembly accessory protein
MFSLTPNAQDYIKHVCEDHKKSAVRLQVKGGGCSGFTYDYQFIDDGQIEKEDFVIDLKECKFVVDGMSVFYVAGTELDYETSLAGSSLKLNNPQQKSSCGCGKSFSI